MNINKIKSVILLGILISISACSSDIGKDEGSTKLYKTFSFNRTSNKTGSLRGFTYDDIVEATFTKSGAVTFKNDVESSLSGTYTESEASSVGVTLKITIEEKTSIWEVTFLTDTGFNIKSSSFIGGTISYTAKVGNGTFKPKSNLSISEHSGVSKVLIYDGKDYYNVPSESSISKTTYGTNTLTQNVDITNGGDNETGEYAVRIQLVKVKNVSSFSDANYFSAEKEDLTDFYLNYTGYKTLAPNAKTERSLLLADSTAKGHEISELDNGFYYFKMIVDSYEETNDSNRNNNTAISSIKFEIKD